MMTSFRNIISENMKANIVVAAINVIKIFVKNFTNLMFAKNFFTFLMTITAAKTVIIFVITFLN